RPDPTFCGIATFSFRAWDESGGATGSLTSLAAGSTAFSVATCQAMVAVNTAPVLDTAGNPALPTIPEDTASPARAPASTLLGTAISDQDGAMVVRGFAVTAVTGTGNGAWQFTTNGTTWQSVGAVSDSSALLLRSADKLRFVPAKDWSGQATVSYRAWDQTAGA